MNGDRRSGNRCRALGRGSPARRAAAVRRALAYRETLSFMRWMTGFLYSRRVALRYALHEMAQSRLVTCGGVFVNNALARGPIDDRNGCLQRSYGRGFVWGRPDSFDGGAHLRTDGAVTLVGLGVGAQSFFC